VNTVNYSNHSGYGRLGGSKASAKDLLEILHSMEQNGLLHPAKLLTGYIPGAESLSAVSTFARKLKDEKPDLIYLMDPVIGDGGKLYVAPNVVPVYQSMLPLATIITPNYFEVETLTGTSLKDMTSLRLALKVLHEAYHVPNVVISSIPLKQWLIDALPAQIWPSNLDTSDNDYLLCICSSTVDLGENEGISVIHTQFVPLFPGYFSGVGDLFSALLLGHFQPEGSFSITEDNVRQQTPLSYATSMALTKTHAVLQSTYNYTLTLPEDERQPTDVEKDAADPVRKVKRMKGRELRLVQPEGQNIIRGVGSIDTRIMEPWLDFWAA